MADKVYPLAAREKIHITDGANKTVACVEVSFEVSAPKPAQGHYECNEKTWTCHPSTIGYNTSASCDKVCTNSPPAPPPAPTPEESK